MGGSSGRGRSPTLKPTKVTLYTRIFYKSENNMAILPSIGFVTAVL